MKEVAKPFTTLPPSEEVMLVGMGSLACANILPDESPRVRKQYYLLMDKTDDISAPVKGEAAEGINFWPVGIARLFKRADTAPLEDDFQITDVFYRDTVVFNLGDNLPVAPQASQFIDGHYPMEQAFLLVPYNGETHWFACGGNLHTEDVREIFLDYGNVGMANAKILKEEYDLIVANLPEPEDEEAKKKDKLVRWLIANALIVNFSYTIASQQ